MLNLRLAVIVKVRDIGVTRPQRDDPKKPVFDMTEWQDIIRINCMLASNARPWPRSLANETIDKVSTGLSKPSANRPRRSSKRYDLLSLPDLARYDQCESRL